MALVKKIVLLILLLCIAGLVLVKLASPKNKPADDSWVSANKHLVPNDIIITNTVIMIHGFAGSPFDLKPLAIKLTNLNYRVVLPTTPGQLNQDYSKFFYNYAPGLYINWINNFVSNEIEKTNGKVYLVGFSMGGTLSTIAAVSNKIDKLVLIAPFYSLTTANNFIWKSSQWLSKFINGVPNLTLGAINDPIGDKKYYPGSKVIRLDAYNALELLAQTAIKCIPEIKIPILVLGSMNDKVASFKRTKELFKKNKNVKVIQYEKSNHVLFYDYDKESAISNVVSFLEK